MPPGGGAMQRPREAWETVQAIYSLLNCAGEVLPLSGLHIKPARNDLRSAGGSDCAIPMSKAHWATAVATSSDTVRKSCGIGIPCVRKLEPGASSA